MDFQNASLIDRPAHSRYVKFPSDLDQIKMELIHFLEEETNIVMDVLGLMGVIIIGILIILFNHFLFLSQIPRREDINRPRNTKE
ncbi:MAG: hypothetical protein ACOY16_03845 [Chloroflexota bacterium]